MADAKFINNNGLVRCVYCGKRKSPGTPEAECPKRAKLEPKGSPNPLCYSIWDRWVEAHKGNVPLEDLPLSGQRAVADLAPFIDQLD